jgi:RNA 2',3'-cyclic 3'-phosphodiesterase
MDMLRLFIAVDTPAAVKREMALLRDDLAGRARGVRWEATGKLHCTLRFLGSVERSRLGSIARQVELGTAGIPPLSLTYAGIGLFPDSIRPRIIWIGIREEAGDLALLQERVSRSLRSLGFPPEERPFQPHVTLGRVGGGIAGSASRVLIDIVKTCTFDHPPVIVPAVEIMQSVLRPRGSDYVLLRSIPLMVAGGVSPGSPGES